MTAKTVIIGNPVMVAAALVRELAGNLAEHKDELDAVTVRRDELIEIIPTFEDQLTEAEAKLSAAAAAFSEDEGDCAGSGAGVSLSNVKPTTFDAGILGKAIADATAEAEPAPDRDYFNRPAETETQELERLDDGEDAPAVIDATDDVTVEEAQAAEDEGDIFDDAFEAFQEQPAAEPDEPKAEGLAGISATAADVAESVAEAATPADESPDEEEPKKVSATGSPYNPFGPAA